MPGDERVQTLTAWTLVLWQWCVPIAQSVDPDWALLATWPVASAALAMWGLAAGVICQAWRTRAWGVLLIGWTAILIAPRLIWQLGEGLHEHHLYLATIAMSLAVGRLLSWRTA